MALDFVISGLTDVDWPDHSVAIAIPTTTSCRVCQRLNRLESMVQ